MTFFPFQGIQSTEIQYNSTVFTKLVIEFLENVNSICCYNAAINCYTLNICNVRSFSVSDAVMPIRSFYLFCLAYVYVCMYIMFCA